MRNRQAHAVRMRIARASGGGYNAVVDGPLGKTREVLPSPLAFALGITKPGFYVVEVRKAVRRVRPIISSPDPPRPGAADFTCSACGHRGSFQAGQGRWELPKKCPSCRRVFGRSIGIRGLFDQEGQLLTGDAP